MFTPNGFVLEQACFHVYVPEYGIFLKPHNSLVLALSKRFFDYYFWYLKGFTMLQNVWAVGPCNKSC